MVLIEKFTTKLQITLPNFSTTAYTSYLSGNIKRFYAASAKPKVYVTRQVNKKAIDILKEKCDVTMWKGSDKAVPRDELLKNIKDKSGLFCLLTDKIDKQLLDNAPKLKVVATMSVGYDHFSVKEIKSRGIKMGYTPFILTDATAELTVALLLATSRRIVEGAHEAKSGGWQTWQPFWLCGPGLSGATVGVFGFGRIGQETAKRLKPFNVKKILFFDPAKKQKEAQAIGATQVNFDELLKNSDFITVNCALTPKTMGIFNDSAFKKMKKNAVFVNTSRGPVVDQKALIKALQEKTIYGAGLDVTVPEPLPLDSPLFKMKNCVILPHIGSATIDTRNAMAELTSKNIVNALGGKKMPAELVV